MVVSHLFPWGYALPAVPSTITPGIEVIDREDVHGENNPVGPDSAEQQNVYTNRPFGVHEWSCRESNPPQKWP
jgi:hypothetical protein